MGTDLVFQLATGWNWTINMGIIQTTSISLLLISLPWLCVCQPTGVIQPDGKTLVENTVDERTQINLNSAAGQIGLLVGAIIIFDIFISVFAFGFLNQETKKKYERQGFKTPYQALSGYQIKPKVPNPFRRRPSALAITLRKKLRKAFTPKR